MKCGSRDYFLMYAIISSFGSITDCSGPKIWEVPGSHAQNRPVKLFWASGLAAVALMDDMVAVLFLEDRLVSFSEALGSVESGSATGASLDPKG